MTRYYL